LNYGNNDKRDIRASVLLFSPRTVRKAAFFRVFDSASFIRDHNADDKTENITKGSYDARRKKALDQLSKNIGPMKKRLFGKHTPP